MLFNDGLSLDRQQLHSGGFGSLTDTIFQFANSLKTMDVDETEYAVLAAICLISGGTSLNVAFIFWAFSKRNIPNILCLFRFNF